MYTALLQEYLGHDSQMDSLEAHVSLNAGLNQLAHLLQNKVGHDGDPFHFPLLCNPHRRLLVNVILGFVFLVLAILASTSTAILGTREATRHFSTDTSYTDNLDS
jgi:hypothetical protein